MQLEKALINDSLVFQKYVENFTFQLIIIYSNLPMKFAIFLKIACFLTVSFVISVYKQNLKT